uniref:Uncharacterized protein n=1 Tax=Anguilla anguilla TaxID=7936 RepID=A0A0E9TVF0_ANGAN
MHCYQNYHILYFFQRGFEFNNMCPQELFCWDEEVAHIFRSESLNSTTDMFVSSVKRSPFYTDLAVLIT